MVRGEVLPSYDFQMNSSSYSAPARLIENKPEPQRFPTTLLCIFARGLEYEFKVTNTNS
jgi:hypothetical protein